MSVAVKLMVTEPPQALGAEICARLVLCGLQPPETLNCAFQALKAAFTCACVRQLPWEAFCGQLTLSGVAGATVKVAEQLALCPQLFEAV